MDIVRPTLVIDKEICLRNIERMAKKAKSKNLFFRPHFKTHQSIIIGEWFRDFGVTAITVSSVQMAQYFAKNGWNDITIAFPVNVHEIDAINKLASEINLNILIENKESLEYITKFIKSHVGVFIEIDTGHNRTGISPNKTNLIDRMIEILKENSFFHFKGFLSHTGHTYLAKSKHDIFNRHFDAVLKMRDLKNRYLSNCPNLMLSLGDTPSATICDNFQSTDEIRPGNFIFYDLMQLKLGVCQLEDIAVRLVCPVVGRHGSRNEVVIYGGSVHISRDSITNIDGKELYGRIIVDTENGKEMLSEMNYLHKLSQEHGIIRTTYKDFNKFKVGDLIEILPVHSCLTANLAENYLTTNGEIIPVRG